MKETPCVAPRVAGTARGERLAQQVDAVMELIDRLLINCSQMTSLDRLTGFYWVARTQGYARAVRSFPYPITEPGVHQQVRRLEKELGVPLFVRVGKDRVVP